MRSNFAPKTSVPWWSELDNGELEKLAKTNPKVADNIVSEASKTPRVTLKASRIDLVPVVSPLADANVVEVITQYEVASKGHADCSIDVIPDADLAACFEDSRYRVMMAYMTDLQASDAQIALKARSSAAVSAQAQARAKMAGKSLRRGLGWNSSGKCRQLASKSMNIQ